MTSTPRFSVSRFTSSAIDWLVWHVLPAARVYLGGGIPQLVVTFIAILELAKETLVEITQTETLGKIYVRTSNSNSVDTEPA